jgi:hypothetical protein
VAEKTTFRISALAAPYVGEGKPREVRLKAAAGEVKLPAQDLVVLIYYLCHDADTEVKRRALETLRRLDIPFLSHLLSNPELHPRILDALVQLHFSKTELAPLFSAHPRLSEKAAAFLAGKGLLDVPEPPPAQPPSKGADIPPGQDDQPVDETTEEFQSKYQLSQNMGIGEKIKMALTGDKEWRTILIKDSNKLVSGSVIKNPRITEGEVLTIAKSSVQNDEIMRVICANKEWVKNAQIRKALVVNHKTPLPAALRFVATLSEKELSLLAKSKNISSVIASQARRILMSKKDGR